MMINICMDQQQGCDSCYHQEHGLPGQLFRSPFYFGDGIDVSLVLVHAPSSEHVKTLSKSVCTRSFASRTPSRKSSAMDYFGLLIAFTTLILIELVPSTYPALSAALGTFPVTSSFLVLSHSEPSELLPKLVGAMFCGFTWSLVLLLMYKLTISIPFSLCVSSLVVRYLFLTLSS